jgi:hypothetical protein
LILVKEQLPLRLFQSLFRPLVPRGPLSQVVPEDTRPVVLVSLLDAAAPVRDRAIRLHHKDRGYRVVFVATDPEIASFRNAGLIVEYLPSPALVMSFQDRGDWENYLLQKWALILTKWQPELALTEGITFDQYLRACGFSASFSAIN